MLIICSRCPRVVAACSVQELHANLPLEAAANLSGVAGAAQLKQAGYTALAVQAGVPDGAISMWDLRLAGYLPGDGAGTDGGGSSSRNDCGSGDRPTPCSRSINCSSAGVAASSASAVDGNNNVQMSHDKQQRPQQQQLLRADGAADVAYFRQQVKPLMHMQPGVDLPDLLIGTQVSPATVTAC